MVKQRRGKGRGEEGRGGFGSAGPLRTGGVGVSRTGGFGTTMPGTSRPTGIAGEAGGGSSGGGKVGDYLMIYSVSFSGPVWWKYRLLAGCLFSCFWFDLVWFDEVAFLS